MQKENIKVNQMNCYRHGDVVLVPVSEIPRTAKDAGHRTLAQGEVTGHSHRIASGIARYLEEAEARFLRVGDGGAVLTHEEHGDLTVPRGDYQVMIQSEYSPEGWRRVAD